MEAAVAAVDKAAAEKLVHFGNFDVAKFARSK